MTVFLDKAQPKTWEAAQAFSASVSEGAHGAGLSDQELELMKVRASSINGCAFCLDLHSRGARGAGVPQQKLDILPAWRDSPLFSSRERALLSVIEAATDLPLNHVSREELEAAQDSLGDEAFAAAQWVGVAINTFNRISLLSHHPVRERNADGKIVR